MGNDLNAGGKALVVVTGANRGGETTFLRSVGLAHLMMQCGMFVAAVSFSAAVCRRVFTHFRRDEDRSMAGGKLEEELARMSSIISGVSPGCLLLCNEPFASTNEREGSDIGRQVFLPLARAGVRVVVVTHLVDLAESLYEQRPGYVLFLPRPKAKPGPTVEARGRGRPKRLLTLRTCTNRSSGSSRPTCWAPRRAPRTRTPCRLGRWPEVCRFTQGYCGHVELGSGPAG